MFEKFTTGQLSNNGSQGLYTHVLWLIFFLNYKKYTVYTYTTQKKQKLREKNQVQQMNILKRLHWYTKNHKHNIKWLSTWIHEIVNIIHRLLFSGALTYGWSVIEDNRIDTKYTNVLTCVTTNLYVNTGVFLHHEDLGIMRFHFRDLHHH